MAENSNKNLAEIIYVFDGFCGWCWGMSETIVRLEREFGDRFKFSALCGGLVTGERIGPLGKDFSLYVAKAIPRIEEMTGAVFSTEYKERMARPQTLQNSLIPAAVFSAILEKQPDANTIVLSHALLSLNFQDGLDLTDLETYTPLLKSYDVEPTPFQKKYHDGGYSEQVEAQFHRARELDAESFPTLVYGQNENYFPLVAGFQPYKNLAHALDTLHRDPPKL